MTTRVLGLLVTFISLISSFAAAQEELYLIENNRIVLILYYYQDELAELEQLIETDHNINRTDERPGEDDNVRRYPAPQPFLMDYHNGLLIWSPPSSPLHNNLNNQQPVHQAGPGPIAARSYPLICLQHFNHGECGYPRCRLTHLTPAQRQTMLQLPNFRSAEGINPVICIRFSRGECDDNNCPHLHVRFGPDKQWLPRYE